jgi:alkanesulfonate monooxygenase SsuD/methylene tetrahydromethanopterin reductase-like flavin-dependent oxidoreductase (luciferase family)
VFFGIVPREWGDFRDEAVQQSVLAQKLGFHSIWIEEHHGNPDYLPSPIVAAAALSQYVPKMQVGTAVAVLPLYNPVRFASDIAVLDNATGGKVVVGVGVGYRDSEFEALDVPLEERGSRMDESVRLISSLLSGDTVNHKGRHFSLSGFRLFPRPLQVPRPQIWIGGWKDKSMERVAKMGDRWLAGPVASFAVLEEAIGLYKEELKRNNRKFSGFALMRDAYVSYDERHLMGQVEKSVIHMYGEDYSGSGHPLVAGQRTSARTWVEERFIQGTPAQCVEAINRLKKKGVNHLIMRVSLRQLPHTKVIETIRLFGTKVIPNIE